MNKQEVIKKIRKLLSLSSSSNENEAQSAMLMAQKLMAQYEIEMSQVQDTPIDHEVVEEQGDKKAHRCPWKRALASTIAKEFKCDNFFHGYDTFTTIFVGKKDAVAICKEVYSSALRFIDREFHNFWVSGGNRDESGWLRPVSDAISMKSSYASGFTTRLRQRFDEQRREAEKEGWGLVLVKDQDVVQYMEQKKFSGKISNAVPIRSNGAYEQGYSDCGSKFGDTGLRRVEG